MLNASTTPGGHVRRTSRKCKPRNFPGRQIYPTHHAHAFRGPGFLFPRGVRCSLMYSREVTARPRRGHARARPGEWTSALEAAVLRQMVFAFDNYPEAEVAGLLEALVSAASRGEAGLDPRSGGPRVAAEPPL